MLIARDTDGLAQTARLCTSVPEAPEVSIYGCDLTDEAAVEALLSTHKPIFDALGMLVNNAGFFDQTPVEQATAADFRAQFEVNTLSAIHLTQRLIPFLRRQPEARLSFICSITAQRGQARCGAYSASKQALNGYIQSLRESLQDSPVAVTSVLLGQTWSTSWEGAPIDPHRLIDPADVGIFLNTLCDMSARSCIEELVMRPQQGDL
ncbi:MAG: SDR family NAD(P)-dependent oxidoreductase [Cyclonatronaceae bacterium]